MKADYVISEASAASPDMSDEQFDRLVADIRAHGQLVPIIVRGDVLVDGRKRLAACLRLGIAPKSIELGDGQTPEAAAQSLNLLRTHYTPGQLAMYAAKLANRPRGSTSSSLGITQRAAGKLLGVPQTAVSEAKRIRRKAHPETIAAVEQGKITLGAARKIVGFSKEQQTGKVAAAVKSARGSSRRQSSGSRFGRRANGRSAAERFGRAVLALLSALEVMAEQPAAEVANDKTLRELHGARAELARIIHAIERAKA